MTTPPIDPARARLTSGYGWRFQGTDLHTGIDLSAPEGTPVRAVRAGRVLVSAPSGQLNKYGQVLVIEHSGGEATLYAHLSARHVARGDQVAEGQHIGAVGRTGGTREQPGKLVSSPHLHFEVLRKWPPSGKDEDRIDPSRLWPPAMHAPQLPRDRPPPMDAEPTDTPKRPRSGAGLAIVAALLLSQRHRL